MSEYMDWELKHVNDPRTTDELLNEAMTADDKCEDDPGTDAITSLQYRATREVFEKTAILCASEDSRSRAIGAAILGDLSQKREIFTRERLDILLHLLHGDEDPDVLKFAAIGLSFFKDPQVIEPLCSRAKHGDARVRESVVTGLFGRPDDRAIVVLIELSNDVAPDVRAAAVCALAIGIDVNTPEIRTALWNRTSDEVVNVPGYALTGLAKRHDPKVFEAVDATLRSGYPAVWAAELLSDSRLIPALEFLLLLRRSPHDSSHIVRAIESCRRNESSKWNSSYSK